MKLTLSLVVVLALVSAALLPGCATRPVSTTAADIAETALTAYTAYAATTEGALTPSKISDAATAASADLSGIATLAQAYVGAGKSPGAAALQTGASNSATAAAIISALPNAPITQATASMLFEAAALLAARPKQTPAQ